MNMVVLKKVALVLVATLFAGCQALQPSVAPPTEEPVEIVVAEPPPPSVDVAPKPAPPKPKPAPPPLPPVSIVMTNSQPAYADVARELTQQFENYSVFNLAEDSRPPVTVLRLINDSEPGVVIAIGLRAAVSSVAMSNQPVVFSQVFNYEHHDLVQDNSRGISALPPIDAQLAAWKEFDPTVERIGLILGEGHDELITEAEIAAQRHGIELVVHVTRSDKETLYVFQRMIRDVDGFWLLPDNRVLSSRVLQQMLADAKRRRVPVSVPSDSMLSLGAMLSMTTKASDIAATIANVVRKIQSGGIDRVPPITQLSEITVKTNDAGRVANR
jgi:ABC-type uncharacterized transport system substrate-binding protein